MPYLSVWRIDFMPGSGGSIRLLEFGDEMGDELEMGVSQQTSTYAAIGALWGAASAEGGARRDLGWSRMMHHASLPAARNHCIAYPALLPFGKSGKIRLSIQGGAVFDLMEAVILSAPTAPADTRGFSTNTIFRASAGKAVPVSGLPLTAGLPVSWQLVPIGSISTPVIGSL